MAEHSYYVCLYAQMTARLVNWKGDLGLLMMCALHHDLDETITGDVPGPTKRAMVDEDKMRAFIRRHLDKRFGSFQMFYPDECEAQAPGIIRILKVANGLDEVFYLATEMQLGNRSVDQVYRNRLGALKVAWNELPAGNEIDLGRMWNEEIMTAIRDHGSSFSEFYTGETP